MKINQKGEREREREREGGATSEEKTHSFSFTHPPCVRDQMRVSTFLGLYLHQSTHRPVTDEKSPPLKSV